MDTYEFHFEPEPNENEKPNDFEEVLEEFNEAVEKDIDYEDEYQEPIEDDVTEQTEQSTPHKSCHCATLNPQEFLPTWGWWVSAIVGAITAALYLISTNGEISSTIFFKAIVVALVFGGIMALGVKAIIKTSLLEDGEDEMWNDEYDRLEDFEYFDEIEDYDEYTRRDCLKEFVDFIKEGFAEFADEAGMEQPKEEVSEFSPILANMSQFSTEYALKFQEQDQQIHTLQNEFDDFISRKKLDMHEAEGYQQIVANTTDIVVQSIETADAWTKHRSIADDNLSKDLEKILESNEIVINQLSVLISNLRTDETHRCMHKSKEAVAALEEMQEKLVFYPEPHIQ